MAFEFAFTVALTAVSQSIGILSESPSNLSDTGQIWRAQSELPDGKQNHAREVSQASGSRDILAVERRKAVRNQNKRWPNATVPYSISSSIDSLNASARLMIREAMIHWEKETCIRFVPANPWNNKDVVNIVKGEWCTSFVGRIGGPQQLTLARECLSVGTIIHELGHAIGWEHEHTRPDRDNYLKIIWSEIQNSSRHNYVKYNHNLVDTFGLPYDYESIMHYHGGSGTLKALQPSKQRVMGQSARLTFYDIKLANLMYKCAEKNRCNADVTSCTGEGYVGPKCTCVCRDGSTKCATKGRSNKQFPDFSRHNKFCQSLKCGGRCKSDSILMRWCSRTSRNRY